MSPEKFAQNWRTIALQLATLVSDDDARTATHLLDRQGVNAVWAGASGQDWQDAASWLALPPARLVKKWASVTPDERPVLALRLQYLAHLSANAAAIAEQIAYLQDDSRKALESCARQLLELPTIPSAQDLRDSLGG